MKKKQNKRQKRKVPAHKAHPLVNAGEVNKQFVIIAVAIVAIVVLAMLLLFSNQFVGKAIEFSEDTGGLSTSTELDKLVKNVPLDITVSANFAKGTKKVSFTLDLDRASCDTVKVLDLLGDSISQLLVNKCENGKAVYDYVTLGKGNNFDSLQGQKDVAKIMLTKGLVTNEYVLKFDEFSYIDQDFKKKVITTETLVLVVKDSLEVPPPPPPPVNNCGNDRLDQEEACDGTHFSKVCNDYRGEENKPLYDGGQIKCTKDCKLNASSCNKVAKEFQDSSGGVQQSNKSPSNLCSNGLIDKLEECDDPQGDSSGAFVKNCNGLGFNGGLIKCTKECKYDVSACNKPSLDDSTPQGDATDLGDEVPVAGAGTTVAGGTGNGTGTGDAGAGTTVAGGTGNGTGTGDAGAGTTTVAKAGIKISLTELVSSGNVFATKIIALEDFNEELTVYTILYGDNNKVLSIKSEKVEAGLKKGESYTASVNYLKANVKMKVVIAYDMESSPKVYGKLENTYVTTS